MALITLIKVRVGIVYLGGIRCGDTWEIGYDTKNVRKDIDYAKYKKAKKLTGTRTGIITTRLTE